MLPHKMRVLHRRSQIRVAHCLLHLHDIAALRAAFSNVPLETAKPTAIICHTVKGKGVGFVENNMDWHHKNRVTPEEIEALLSALETS